LTTTQTPFDALLAWLDPDREVAAQKYETIRAGLIRIFVAKGLNGAEDLADDSITRVVKRLPEIRDSYVGDPAAYFHGVARNVLRESYRPKEIPTDVSPIAHIRTTNRSDEYECLMRCLKFLTPDKRDLILDYHVYEGHDKIEQHKIMAEELGISKGALRLRAHHIRGALEKCVQQCTENLKQQTKDVARSILDSGAETRSVSNGPGRTI
jgi:DNA-directed RNA polymerase specialized sigma24 family protein